jgi:4-amino-4-deoxy-L-arabinose transferase-like glycosyltransferase
MKTNRLLSLSDALPVLILAAAMAFRFYGLDRLSLWADELWVVMGSVQGSLAGMLDNVYHHDNHPPGYYLLLRYTQQVFGNSDFIIRFPSAIAGSLLVLATFCTGKKYISFAAGVIAAALVTGSYQAIYYSQEARPNIFMVLFSLLAFHYFYAVMFEGQRSWKNYLLFWISAVASSYFHYAGLVFCACLGLLAAILLATRRRKEDVLTFAALFLPCALCYAPWVPGVLHQLVNTPVTAWQRTPDFQTLHTTFTFLFGPDTLRITFYQLVVIAGVALMCLSAHQRRLLACLLGMAMLPVAVFYLKSAYSQDAYNHRHFLYAIPMLALVAGSVLDSLLQRVKNKHRSKVFLAIVAIIFACQYIANNNGALYTANHFKQEFREGAQVVADDHAFLQTPHHLVLSNIVFFDHYLLRFTRSQQRSDLIYEHAAQREEVATLVSRQPSTGFYYLEAPLIPAANQMVTAEDLALAERYQPLCRTRFARVQVWRFAVAPPDAAIDFSALPDCRKSAT